LEGEGREISSETRDAYIADDHSRARDHTPDAWMDRLKNPSSDQ
jgi:hypothetical protein